MKSALAAPSPPPACILLRLTALHHEKPAAVAPVDEAMAPIEGHGSTIVRADVQADLRMARDQIVHEPVGAAAAAQVRTNREAREILAFDPVLRDLTCERAKLLNQTLPCFAAEFAQRMMETDALSRLIFGRRIRRDQPFDR